MKPKALTPTIEVGSHWARKSSQGHTGKSVKLVQ